QPGHQPCAVLIVGLFTSIAVARGPRHQLGHCRSFPGEQKPVLVFEALQAARRDVVLDSRGGLVSLRFSRKPFSHTVSPSSANPVRPQGFQEMDRAHRLWKCSTIVTSRHPIRAFAETDNYQPFNGWCPALDRKLKYGGAQVVSVCL